MGCTGSLGFFMMDYTFIRKSGLIPRSSAAAEITHYLQKFGIKPDGINRTGDPQFPIERASAKQSGTKDTAGITPRLNNFLTERTS
jgi:hypothetical protein